MIYVVQTERDNDGGPRLFVLMHSGDLAALGAGGSLLAKLSSERLVEAGYDLESEGFDLVVGAMPGASSDQQLADALRRINPTIDDALRVDTEDQP